MINCMSLFPNENILTKEIESGKGFANSLHSDNRELFMNMLNDCYKYAAAINAKGQPFPAEPLIMALLLPSQHKMIDWLTKQISKHESVNINKVKKAKQQQEADLARENTNEYIRKNERIHYIDDY
jgi:anion-transporting  ArsA/GET3 family ATPase